MDIDSTIAGAMNVLNGAGNENATVARESATNVNCQNMEALNDMTEVVGVIDVLVCIIG